MHYKNNSFGCIRKTKSVLSALLRAGFIFVLLASCFSGTSFADDAVVETAEYYYQPSCGSCKDVNKTMSHLKEKYPSVTFSEYDITEPDNYNRMVARGGAFTPFVYTNGYGFGEDGIQGGDFEKALLGTYVPPTKESDTTDSSKTEDSTIETIMKKFEFLKKFGSIGHILNEKINNSKYLFAYAFGVFSGLSTCLVAMVGFIFVYTTDIESNQENGKKRIGKSEKRNDFFKILYRLLVFSAGLITCYLIIGYTFILFKKSVPDATLISYAIGILVILFGLNMIGILKIPIELGEKFKELTRKYISSTLGLFFIGCLFSFVKVPCTFPFLIILIDKTVVTGSLIDLLMLFIFCLGVTTPLILIGTLGSYALTRMIRTYKKEIRTVSGIVLIVLGLWVMFY